MSSRNKTFKKAKVEEFEIQSVELTSKTLTENSLSSARDEITLNTSSATNSQTVVINDNLGTQTTAINGNTNSETGDIKTRISKAPIKVHVTNSTFSSSWANLYSYTGSGTLEFVQASVSSYHPTSGNMRFTGVRVIIDGVQRFLQGVNGSTSGVTYTSGGLLQYDIGANNDLLNVASLFSFLGLQFESSIQIDFLNDRAGGDDAGLVKTNEAILIIRET